MNQKPAASLGQAERLPFGKKIIYSLGQLGWSLASYGAANFLMFFYLPPSDGQAAIFPRMIPQGRLLFGLTLIGLILAFGRIFDGITDPLIAVLSDRSRSRLGRRRSFLAVAVVPFALFSVLVFLPPFGTGAEAATAANAVWLFVSVTLLYWFMTMYVTPFFAWMSELGKDSDERLQLSTMISITWAIGAMLGAQAPAVQGLFEGAGFSSLAAFQMAMLVFGGIALVLMLLPIIFIDERRYSNAQPCHDGFFSSIRTVLKDRNFFIFTLSDFAYWVSLFFINTGLMYYITALLGLPKELYSQLFIVMFILSFACYVPVSLLAKRLGRRRLLVTAFALFGLTFIFCSLFGILPLPLVSQAWIAAVLAAIPLAIFGILPNAMVSDMAEAYAITTGQHKAGVFFGFRTFMSKMGQSVGAIIMPSLIMIGASGQGDEVVGSAGVRISTFFALGFCLAGLILLLAYNEKKVMAVLKEHREQATRA